MRFLEPARPLFFAGWRMGFSAGMLLFLLAFLASASDVPPTSRVRLRGLAIVATAPVPERRTAPLPPSGPVYFREVGWKVAPSDRETPPVPISFSFLGGVEGTPSLHASANDWNREFIAALGRRFLKEEVLVRAVWDASHAREQGCPEMVSEFTWYDGDFREVAEVRRELAVNLVSGAAADTLEKTAPGRWVRALEAAVERYSRVSYRRPEGAEAGHFLLPGQVRPENPAAEDPVAVTAGARLHLDSDDLAPEVTFTVLADYFGYRCRFLMNPLQGEAGLFLAAEALDRLFGLRAGLGLSFDRAGEEENALAGVVRFSGDF